MTLASAAPVPPRMNHTRKPAISSPKERISSASRSRRSGSEALLIVGKSIQIFGDLLRARFACHSDPRHSIPVTAAVDQAKLRSHGTNVSRFFHLPDLTRTVIAGHAVRITEALHRSPEPFFDLGARPGQFLPGFLVRHTRQNGMRHRMRAYLHQAGSRHFPKLGPGTGRELRRSRIWEGHVHALRRVFNPRVTRF